MKRLEFQALVAAGDPQAILAAFDALERDRSLAAANAEIYRASAQTWKDMAEEAQRHRDRFLHMDYEVGQAVGNLRIGFIHGLDDAAIKPVAWNQVCDRVTTGLTRIDKAREQVRTLTARDKAA